ncbi:BTB/POZ domain-containing protein At2g13690-like [Phoenix dactylifera]|uniref:BTB/POZ domain-containing protein At2g13690-like n=1 Tax=Phoenix dactylifera TaxID=42345 RepID=A0A8B9ASN3_PHODC|nr:BTB/POZ domain-containing protein At2g13690-like [Phoenix dactylifera]
MPSLFRSPTADSGGRRSASRRRNYPSLRQAWCCSLAVAPHSPEILVSSSNQSKLPQKTIDPRRILPPGGVSPIATDPPLPKTAAEESELRVRLRGKDGRWLELDLDSDVLCENSSFFARMVAEARRKVSDVSEDSRKIEVEELEDLDAFKETIELMFEKDAMRWLMNAGVSRAIDVLEVSSMIMFDRGVASCVKYLEAVPWSENDEEKLMNLFARSSFDVAMSRDVLARLYPQGPSSSQDLVVQLIQSVTKGTDSNARKRLQSLVYGLLSRSSFYHKGSVEIYKDSLYSICRSCLNSLVGLFQEASASIPVDRTETVGGRKTLIEQISKQVENINWLLEILIDKHIAEDFVELWADQKELIRLHEKASPMIRYELSRISASVFIVIGRGKLHCCRDKRFSVLRAWFSPILMDFGWLQRCSKGLDMRVLEEGLGQAILTLTLNQQQSLFLEWFGVFGRQGIECPNLSKAFQVWWRRSFVRTTEA